jgi:hypothetical protein
MRPMNRWLGLAWLPLCALLASCGCNGPGQPTFRFGSLPFHGLMLGARADPERLGEHRYWTAVRMADGETSRGIIYTQKAGFLDIAHIRDTADWTRYFALRVEEALEDGQTSLSLNGPDRTRMHMRFAYPEGWESLPSFERERLIHELALRCGQEAAYAHLTWHEVITWYDYGKVPLISEAASSFTYDDVMSHVIGLYAVERAWNDRTRDYNDAMTAALDELIHELEPATRERTAEAIEEVEGWWWKRGRALKRHLDTGLAQGEVVPMLIPDFVVSAGAAPVEPGRFRLPRVEDVEAPGMGFGGFMSMELEPRMFLYRRLRAMLPGEPDRIVPERDIPLLLVEVRRQMEEELGPDMDLVEERPPGAQTAAARGH